MNSGGTIQESIKNQHRAADCINEDKTTWNQLMDLFLATPFLSIVQISNHEAADQDK